MIPRGYDPATDTIGCPECGETLDAEWTEVSTYGAREPQVVLCSLRCPTSRSHEVGEAYEALKVVDVAHPDRGDKGACTLLALDRWREVGWYPVDPQYQTPSEMVEAQVRAQQAGAES